MSKIKQKLRQGASFLWCDGGVERAGIFASPGVRAAKLRSDSPTEVELVL